MSVTLAKQFDNFPHTANRWADHADMIVRAQAVEPDEWNAGNIACGIIRNDPDALWAYYQASRNAFEYAPVGAVRNEYGEWV